MLIALFESTNSEIPEISYPKNKLHPNKSRDEETKIETMLSLRISISLDKKRHRLCDSSFFSCLLR